MTETLLSIVILATPGEYLVQSLLTKSLKHSSTHYFCFCSVKLPNFFDNELNLTTNNEYSGRIVLNTMTMHFLWSIPYSKVVSNFTRLSAREITYHNFEISLVVFMPNITTNHAITYTNIQLLPKAADLRKKAFDELRLNMLIVLL